MNSNSGFTIPKIAVSPTAPAANSSPSSSSNGSPSSAPPEQPSSHSEKSSAQVSSPSELPPTLARPGLDPPLQLPPSMDDLGKLDPAMLNALLEGYQVLQAKRRLEPEECRAAIQIIHALRGIQSTSGPRASGTTKRKKEKITSLADFEAMMVTPTSSASR